MTKDEKDALMAAIGPAVQACADDMLSPLMARIEALERYVEQWRADREGASPPAATPPARQDAPPQDKMSPGIPANEAGSNGAAVARTSILRAMSPTQFNDMLMVIRDKMIREASTGSITPEFASEWLIAFETGARAEFARLRSSVEGGIALSRPS